MAYFNSAINLDVTRNTSSFSVSGSNSKLSVSGEAQIFNDGSGIFNGQLLIGSSGENAFVQGSVIGNSGVTINSGAGTLSFSVTANTFQPLPAFRLITGTADTPTSSDNALKVITTNNATTTITLQSGLASNFSLMLIQGGTGLVTFTTGAGTTINSLGSLVSVSGRYGVVNVLATGQDKFLLYGDLR